MSENKGILDETFIIRQPSHAPHPDLRWISQTVNEGILSLCLPKQTDLPCPPLELLFHGILNQTLDDSSLFPCVLPQIYNAGRTEKGVRNQTEHGILCSYQLFLPSLRLFSVKIHEFLGSLTKSIWILISNEFFLLSNLVTDLIQFAV